MPIVRKIIDISKPGGYIDEARVDATTEEEIEAQIAEDEAEARSGPCTGSLISNRRPRSSASPS